MVLQRVSMSGSPAAAAVAAALLRRRHARCHVGLAGGPLLLGRRAVDGQLLTVQRVRRRHHLCARGIGLDRHRESCVRAARHAGNAAPLLLIWYCWPPRKWSHVGTGAVTDGRRGAGLTSAALTRERKTAGTVSQWKKILPLMECG